MKIERDKIYLTRDGHKVRVVCTDKKEGQPIVGLLLLGDGMEDVQCFCTGGKYFAGSAHESALDLVSEYIEPPQPREVWVRIHSDGYVGTAWSEAEMKGLPDPESLVKFREVIE